MTLRVAAIFAVVGGLALAGDALAEEFDATAPGRAHASSFMPVPDNSMVAVRPWDNSDANLKVRSSLTDALSKRGIKLTERDAPLTLNFETEVENLSGDEPAPSLGQVQAHNWDKRVRMNLWSSTQDSLTQGRRSAGGGSGTVRYVLRATLQDRTGQRLWEGEASYLGAPTDETSTFMAMAPVVVDGLGQTVRPRTFRIQ
jgi:hypothetical protein